MVDMQKITDLTKKLIAIPSQIGNITAQEEALGFVKNYLAEFPSQKYSYNNQSSYFFSNVSPFAKKYAIIFNVHIDVSPGTPAQFIPQEKEGKIYGRGADDMKGAAAVIISVFKEIAPKLSFPIGLQVVTDTNKGGKDGTLAQVKEGILADFVLAGEPSNFALATKYKGCFRFWITFRGKKSHSAFPWSGDNAIWKMNTFLNKLNSLITPVKKDSWKSTVTPTIVQTTNTQTNLVPDDVRLNIDIRFTPEEYTLTTLKKKIREIIPLDAIVEPFWETEPYTVDSKNQYIQDLETIAKQILGKDLETSYSNWSGGDITHFPQNQTVGIEFGPFGHGHHLDTEWVSIKSLENYAIILTEFLLQQEQKNNA